MKERVSNWSYNADGRLTVTVNGRFLLQVNLL